MLGLPVNQRRPTLFAYHIIGKVYVGGILLLNHDVYQIVQIFVRSRLRISLFFAIDLFPIQL